LKRIGWVKIGLSVRNLIRLIFAPRKLQRFSRERLQAAIEAGKVAEERVTFTEETDKIANERTMSETDFDRDPSRAWALTRDGYQVAVVVEQRIQFPASGISKCRWSGKGYIGGLKMNRVDMDYGHYVVGAGKLKGQVVYYDDDSGERSCIVYSGGFNAGCKIIPARFIERPATTKEIKLHEKSQKSIAQYSGAKR
jgi:hypothetical protein